MMMLKSRKSNYCGTSLLNIHWSASFTGAYIERTRQELNSDHNRLKRSEYMARQDEVGKFMLLMMVKLSNLLKCESSLDSRYFQM
jgi:hypothetical protein